MIITFKDYWNDVLVTVVTVMAGFLRFQKIRICGVLARWRDLCRLIRLIDSRLFVRAFLGINLR